MAEGEDSTEEKFVSDVEVPETPPVLPLPYACEAIREAREKVKKIDAELAERLREADAIRKYLDEQREKAKVLDEEDRVELLETTGLFLQNRATPWTVALYPRQGLLIFVRSFRWPLDRRPRLVKGN